MIALVLAALLPAHIDPPAPFPHILTQAPEFSQVAPGVQYGEYDLLTTEGPLAIHAIAVAAHAPDISLQAVLANDALTSAGETISSMAQRTGAIAGINADYFDIGNTNAPTNIVVREGQIVRTPRKRYALLVTSDGTPHIVESGFTGTVSVGARTVALDAINELPPPGGGTSLITPAFGTIAPQNGVTLVALVPETGTPPLCSYRVSAIADETVRNAAGYYLAIGLNAYGSAGVPNAGDPVVASGDLSPIPLAQVSAAVGGGPLLLDAGLPVDDPDGPSGKAFARRIPSSGAAISADGTLLLIEVDGRELDHSLGVTRPEFAALMQGFGAVRGMAFDGGGSSEIVARTPTQLDATLQNDPSDGHERKVADGIFVYDSATPGPAAQLEAAPQAVRAMPGAHVALRFAFADANDRVAAPSGSITTTVEPAALGTIADGAFLAQHAGTGEIVAKSGALETRVPVEIASDPARVEILPHELSAPEDGSLQLHARAYDERGYELALPAVLPWRALNAAVTGNGLLSVAKANVLVSLLLGDRLADATVSVGYHDVPLAVTDAKLMTIPRGAQASVTQGQSCPTCDELNYALGPGERAAYLVIEAPLPEHSVAVAFELDDEGDGGLLKLALRNAIDEEVLLPAAELGSHGWRSIVVRLPASLAQPARLTALYVIGRSAADTAHGTIAIRDLRAVAAGTTGQRP